MYALLTLEVAILLFFLMRILVPPAARTAAGSATLDSGSSWESWAGLSVAQAAIMLTHNTALVYVPVGIALLVSLRRPIFSIHTLLWLALPYLTLVALGTCALAQRWPRLGKVPTAAALVALVVLLHGGALHGYYAYFHKEAWDAAAQAVATQAQPGDLILFNATWVQLPFEYYFQRYEVEAELRGVPADLFERGVLEPVMMDADLARLRELLTAQKAGRNVWLIYSHNWYTDPHGLVLTELTRHLGMGEEQTFTGIRVIRFE
jgi:hypothetical protein